MRLGLVMGSGTDRVMSARLKISPLSVCQLHDRKEINDNGDL
jgi:hypothetical protein